MPNFSSIAAPLNDIVKKDVPFHWGPKQDSSFHTLQNCLTQAPVLALRDLTFTFEIECDASNTGIGVVLTQQGHHLIAYFSKKLKGLL